MLQGALPQMGVARKAKAGGWGWGVQEPGGEAPPLGVAGELSTATQTPEALQQGRACSQTLSL